MDRCGGTKFEWRHQTKSGFSFVVSWHNREFCFTPSEGKIRLYVAAAPSWRGYEPRRTLAVPSNLVYAYKSYAMIDVDKTRTAG